jgi:hypothetical protein
MKQVSHAESTNIWSHRTKFTRPDDLELEICAPPPSSGLIRIYFVGRILEGFHSHFKEWLCTVSF